MRIAVLIIALCFSLAVGFQSASISLGSHIVGNEKLAESGVAGMIVAVLFVIGAAFAIGLPRIAAVVFLLAGLIAVGGQSNGSDFKDLQIWGWLSAILAVMSVIGSFGLRRQKRERANEKRLMMELLARSSGNNPNPT